MSDWRVGKCFLKFDQGGKPRHQGYVIGEAGDGAFDIGFFSWLDGSKSSCCVKPADYLDDAEFFSTDTDMVVEIARRTDGDVERHLKFHSFIKDVCRSDNEPTGKKPATTHKKDKSALRAKSKRLRFHVFKRDHFSCTYCGRRAGPGVELEIDHVVPLAKGGKDEESNLTTSCHECNRGKRDTVLDAAN